MRGTRCKMDSLPGRHLQSPPYSESETQQSEELHGSTRWEMDQCTW